MRRFIQYKFILYFLFIVLLSGILFYSLSFLYKNFYLTISWAVEADIYTVEHIKKVQTEKLDELVKFLRDRADFDPRQKDLSCLSQDCRVTTTQEVEVELTCRPDLGAGGGADCNWGQAEIHENPGGDPNKNFMIYKIDPAVKPLSLSMRWPSIMNCDAYEVFLSSNGSNWLSLGKVPTSACPYEEKTVLANYELRDIDFPVNYMKISKLYDNEGDDSVDTPVEIKLRGGAEIRSGEDKKINFCSP